MKWTIRFIVGLSLMISGHRSIVLRFPFIFTAALACLTGIGPEIVNAGPVDKTIKMGVPSTGWPPYIIVKQDQIYGILIDVCNAISSRRGYGFQFTLYPDKRASVLLEKGDIDAWPDSREWFNHPERYFWSGDIIQSEDILISSSDRPIVFNRIEDLFGKTIATQYNYVYPDLDEYFNQGKIQRVGIRGNIPMLKMVHMGRANAAVINKWVALWELSQDKQLKYSDFTFSKKVVGSAGYGLLFSNAHDWQPFVEEFRDELNSMKQDGRFNQIITRYR